MAVSIPLSDRPHFSEQVTLEDVTYTFEFRWNTREASWYLNIMEEDETAIASGIKVVLGLPLGLRCKSPKMPPGKLITLDTSGQDLAPGLHDLGTRVTITYLTAAEVAEVV